MSQHCSRAIGHRVVMYCDMLGVVGSSLKMVKFEPTTPNTSQHVAIWLPNARNMLHSTMLRDCNSVAFFMLRSFGRGLWPGSKAFTSENNLLLVFLKVYMAMEPDLAHS